MLELKGVNKIYEDPKRGAFHAVKDLSFTCEAGKILGFIGMNGAGKSTTLRMIATMLQPESGTINLNGIDVLHNPLETRRNIGYLSGSTGLYRRLSALETLKYFGTLHGLDEKTIKERSDELIELLNMESFLDRHCDKLSSGQKQKVNIARTLIHDPDLIILDEVTTGLDILSVRGIVQFIKAVKERNKMIIFCSHHLDEIRSLSDQILVLHHGQSAAYGSLTEVEGKTHFKTLEGFFDELALQEPDR
jgi:sodium transport system ATP-binding protein